MKRFALLGLLVLTVASNALAAEFVCKTLPGIDIAPLAILMKATVVDSDGPDNTYLLSAKTLPTVTPAGGNRILRSQCQGKDSGAEVFDRFEECPIRIRAVVSAATGIAPRRVPSGPGPFERTGRDHRRP